MGNSKLEQGYGPIALIKIIDKIASMYGSPGGYDYSFSMPMWKPTSFFRFSCNSDWAAQSELTSSAFFWRIKHFNKWSSMCPRIPDVDSFSRNCSITNQWTFILHFTTIYDATQLSIRILHRGIEAKSQERHINAWTNTEESY